MIFSSVLVLVGLVLLVVGGELLLRGAVGLATLLRLTPAIIGLTVVAAGTSVPELAVSGIAAMQDRTDLAVGNVVGSNIFNITVIVALGALIRPLVIGGNTVKLEYPVLAIVTLLCVAMCGHGSISRLDGVTLLVIYVAFMIYLVSLVRQQMSQAEVKEFRAEVTELGGTDRQPRWWLSVLYVVVGVALLGGGAHATVEGAIGMARILGLSERVIGLTIVAAGTGLPEVVTTLVSTYRGRDDVAIGNVIGSNLFNILVILGLSAVIRPIPVAAGIVASDGWWMLGVTLLLFVLMHTGPRIRRAEGILLLAIYCLYIGLLLGRPES